MKKPSKQTLLTFLFFFILLTIIGLVGSVQNFLLEDVERNLNFGWDRLISFNLFIWWFWLFSTPGIIWLAKKFPIERHKIIKPVSIHLLISLVVVFIHQTLTAIFCNHTFGSIYYLPVFKKLAWRIIHLEWLFVDFMVYFAILGGYLAWQYYRKYQQEVLICSRLENRLVQSQLRALKMQLHPHFLYNTLNTISTLVLKDNRQEAVKMISVLADLLRTTLDNSESQLVTLQHELEFIEKYLSLQKARFTDRLEIVYNIDHDLLSAMVPNLILQPLVENAILHAIVPRETGGKLEIHANSEMNKLVMSIVDDGPGVNGKIRNGIGISNIRQRLEQLYGNEQQLFMKNQTGGGFAVTIIIPLQNSGSFAFKSLETEATVV